MTIAHLKAIMELYGKTITGLGPSKTFVRTLGIYRSKGPVIVEVCHATLDQILWIYCPDYEL